MTNYPLTSHPPWRLVCEVCFQHISKDRCAVDVDGDVWYICKGKCAKEAGISEAVE